MPRRARTIKRETLPDAKYHNVTVAKLVNKVMQCGKKGTAASIVYGALDLLEQQASKDPVTALEQAVKNATWPFSGANLAAEINQGEEG
jgi:small subunit ribosomal protein S7